MGPLGQARLMAFGATANAERAKAFYGRTLGLRLVEDSPFALAFDASGTMLRIQKVESVTPAGYTALGWEVDDIRAAVRALTQAGVRFQRYPGLQQDDLGIWRSPGGADVAWFQDPDGSTLSLTQMP
jgi:catechol 2,3-dioxygenase-like lactoylglutathione lyase family enzyme